MNVSRVFHHLIATAVAAAAFTATPGAARSQQQTNQLKWTPHRSSTAQAPDAAATVDAAAVVETPAPAAVPAAPAAVPVSPAAVPSGPPASVSLPLARPSA